MVVSILLWPLQLPPSFFFSFFCGHHHQFAIFSFRRDAAAVLFVLFVASLVSMLNVHKQGRNGRRVVGGCWQENRFSSGSSSSSSWYYRQRLIIFSKLSWYDYTNTTTDAFWCSLFVVRVRLLLVPCYVPREGGGRRSQLVHNLVDVITESKMCVCVCVRVNNFYYNGRLY